MTRTLHFVAAILGSSPPAALYTPRNRGGILRQYIIDSPASMSIHEETTVVAERPMMAVFNNLVMFDQHVPQNSLSPSFPILPPTGRGTKTARG